MGPKILIIDDDETMLELLQTLLTLEGFEASALEAKSPLAEMIKVIQAFQPQLILCDVLLKELDGLELLKMIRQQPDLNNIRVLMTSGMDFRRQCLEAQADGFILKPFMPDELVLNIQNILSAAPN